MGIQQSSAFCPVCNKQSMMVRTTPNHLLHLLLSIFTGGLWIPIWILSSMRVGSGWRCASCGVQAKSASSSAGFAKAIAAAAVIITLIIVGHSVAAHFSASR
jgi:hypothetical protein